MSALSDLTAAVTRLNTSVSAEIKAVADALTAQGDNVSAADAEAAAASLNQIADTLDAETAKLTPAPPPPPPTA